MSPRFLSDDALLAQCRVDHYRGSGPGGQKRNKTSNAVRIHHDPSGVIVTGTEDRSTELNKLHAIRRLRVKLSADVREPIDLTTFSPPDWFLSIRSGNQIAVSHRHEFYAAAGGLALDLLKAVGGNPSSVAANLGVSTTAVIKLLQGEHAWWQAANQIRADFSLKVVRSIGSDRFKLLYDIYHMQIMEGDVIATIRKHKDYIGHYHTAGVPGRHELDDQQELNYPPIIRAIIETGYKGWLGQEFIPRSKDPIASLAQAVKLCDV